MKVNTMHRIDVRFSTGGSILLEWVEGDHEVRLTTSYAGLAAGDIRQLVEALQYVKERLRIR